MCFRPFETRSLPSSLATTHRGFAFYVAFPKSSIRSAGLPIHVARGPRLHSLVATSRFYLDHSHGPLLAPATLAALPSTRAIPHRDVFYVAGSTSCIVQITFRHYGLPPPCRLATWKAQGARRRARWPRSQSPQPRRQVRQDGFRGLRRPLLSLDLRRFRAQSPLAWPSWLHRASTGQSNRIRRDPARCHDRLDTNQLPRRSGQRSPTVTCLKSIWDKAAKTLSHSFSRYYRPPGSASVIGHR